VYTHDSVLVHVTAVLEEVQLIAYLHLALPVALGKVNLDLAAKERGQVQRVEGVLGLIEVLELDEAVALGRARVIVHRYYDFDDVAEAAKLVMQVFSPNIFSQVSNTQCTCVFGLKRRQH